MLDIVQPITLQLENEVEIDRDTFYGIRYTEQLYTWGSDHKLHSGSCTLQ